VDTRDTAKRERMELVANEYGVFRCHSVFNCVEACPKHINQNEAIQKLEETAFNYRLGLVKLK